MSTDYDIDDPQIDELAARILNVADSARAHELSSRDAREAGRALIAAGRRLDDGSTHTVPTRIRLAGHALIEYANRVRSVRVAR